MFLRNLIQLEWPTGEACFEGHEIVPALLIYSKLWWYVYWHELHYFAASVYVDNFVLLLALSC